jgi:hypothetical protein
VENTTSFMFKKKWMDALPRTFRPIRGAQLSPAFIAAHKSLVVLLVVAKTMCPLPSQSVAVYRLGVHVLVCPARGLEDWIAMPKLSDYDVQTQFAVATSNRCLPFSTYTSISTNKIHYTWRQASLTVAAFHVRTKDPPVLLRATWVYGTGDESRDFSGDKSTFIAFVALFRKAIALGASEVG